MAGFGCPPRVYGQQCQHKVSLSESGSLIVNADKNLRHILFSSFLIIECCSLADIDRWKTVIGNRMGTIKIALDGIFILLVDGALPFSLSPVRRSRRSCGLGRVPFHSSVTLGRNSGSLRIAASATSKRPSRGRNAIEIFLVEPSLSTTSTPRMTA